MQVYFAGAGGALPRGSRSTDPRGSSTFLGVSGRSAPGGPPARRGPCFLYKKAGGKNRRGFPPAPPGIKPLAGARSLFWVACPLTRSLSGKSAPDQIWNRLFGEKHFTGSCSAKNPAKENLSKESPQIRARTWVAINPTAVPLRLYPKRWSERAASGFNSRVQGGALRFFPPAFL